MADPSRRKLRIPRRGAIEAAIAVAVVIAAILFWFGRPPGIRASWDCWLDVSSELASELNARYEADGRYPADPSDPTKLDPAILAMRLRISKSAEETGRGIRFKGRALDPFSRDPGHADDERRWGYYYHSASAELGCWARGYLPRSAVSSDGQWAVLVSVGPNGVLDTPLEEVVKLAPPDGEEGLTFLVEELSKYRVTGMSDPDTSKGDLITLLWNGEAYRIWLQ
ncbi:hypothetical protein KQI84_07755 [bacterium]|nr:hypothetical protein [bacterium]